MELTLLTNPVQNIAPRTIWCLGRNYAEHARELGNQVETKPLVFQKGLNALAPFENEVPLDWSLGPIHYETELVMLMDRVGDVPRLVGLALGLDLTLRDLQSELKSAGKPWTLAKSFDHAAIVSHFVPLTQFEDLDTLIFTMQLNGELRQTGETRKMILSLYDTMAYLETFTRLRAGDLVFTGTPAGVGELHPGNEILADLAGQLVARIKVI